MTATVHQLATRDQQQVLTVLADAVTAAAAASLVCTRDQLTDACNVDLDKLAGVLAQAHELATYAQEVRASAERAVAALLPDSSARQIDGVGTIRLRPGAERKLWDHDRIRSVILARTLERLTNDAGEIRRSPGVVAEAVADALGEAGHVDYWRVGALRELGLNPDSFCERTQGADKVEFHPEGGRR